jgi:adenine-specific DNA-methyltransferase
MRTLDLFPDIVGDCPATEGIKYAGSKLRFLPHILQLVKRTSARTVFDGFSGTTRVSQAIAKSGYRVISNDISEWSRVFGICYLLNRNEPKHYTELIDHLNSTPPKDGWFTEHYGRISERHRVRETIEKNPWQIHNTRKLDGVREEIERLQLDSVTKAVALTSLILALDEVDSTLGHFASYLKEWSPRSFKNLHLKVPLIWPNRDSNEVCQEDVFAAAPRIRAEVAYYDPPYGSNNEKMPPSRVRYAAYYHLWTTICLFDSPQLFGRANRREDTSDKIAVSPFEEFRRNSDGRFVAVEAIDRLLHITEVPWIILSYSSGGRATADELNEVVHSNGELVDVLTFEHRRHVMSGMRWTNKWVREAEEPNREFLFLMKKRIRSTH